MAQYSRRLGEGLRAMKIGVVTVVYNEERFIKACVGQFAPYDIAHLVLISKKPWHGDSYPQDKTGEYAAEAGASVVEKVWKSEAEQRNYGQIFFEKMGYDWVLIVDADEFYTPQTIANLIEFLRLSNDEALTTPNMLVYWKDENYRISPLQTDNPIIAVRPKLRFSKARQAEGHREGVPAILHHMSYVRTDDEMKKKISSFEHAVDFNIKDWYDNVWLRWTPDKRNLHPVNPPQFEKAILNPIPIEIQEYFNETVTSDS